MIKFNQVQFSFEIYAIISTKFNFTKIYFYKILNITNYYTETSY